MRSVRQVRKRRGRCQTTWKHPRGSMHSLWHNPCPQDMVDATQISNSFHSWHSHPLLLFNHNQQCFMKSELERSMKPLNDHGGTDDDSEHTSHWSGVVRKTEMFNKNDTWLHAHLPASEAAPKWFEDYHDVNICGFDCIMGRSNAGRWSVSGKAELFSSKKKGESGDVEQFSSPILI